MNERNETVIDYWMAFYATDHCTLCGNTGEIDTTGRCTPAGLEVGRKNYCICPNGQSMRADGFVRGVVHRIAELDKNASEPPVDGESDGF